MGTYANLVLFPRPIERRRLLITKRSIPQATFTPEECARQVLSLFESFGFLNVPLEELLEPREIMCYSSQVLNGLPEAIQSVHRQIRPKELNDQIGGLVPTMTEAEVYADLASQEDLSDERFLPWIDVTSTNEIVSVNCDIGQVHSWLFIEFCYPDIRYHPDTHTLVDEHHELVSKLADSLGAEISAAIIPF